MEGGAWIGGLVVKPSLVPLAGKGLFTTEDIPKGTKVCHYTGTVLPTRVAIKQSDKTYLMRLGPQVYVDAGDHPNVLARYINDARRPAAYNVEFDKRPEERVAVVVATKDIPAGAELYVDYGRWYWLKGSPEAAPGVPSPAALADAVAAQGGILFARSAKVGRHTYAGRGFLARNTDFTDGEAVDDRGYLTVEHWVMSKTTAGNPVPKPAEGVTRLLVGGVPYRLDALEAAFGAELFGGHGAAWPLAKILDIGGIPVAPSFAPDAPEVPPIPCHVHNGDVVDGKVVGPGKLEAYFFPPLDVPPYNMELPPVKTRLGVNPTHSREAVLGAVEAFGETDVLYSMLNEYTVAPNEGWTIETGVIHAPGPYPTFEIQLPQDDFNLLAWQLGQRIPPERAGAERERSLLRGCADCGHLVAAMVDWERTSDPEFEAKYRHPMTALDDGAFGRRTRIFHGRFYGEALHVLPGQTYARPGGAGGVPFACLVWSGEGSVNGQRVSAAVEDREGRQEFLVTPGCEVFEVACTGVSELIVYSFWPLDYSP